MTLCGSRAAVAVPVPGLQLHPVGAAVAEGEQGVVLGVASAVDRHVIEASDQDQRPAKGDAAVELVPRRRAVDQRSLAYLVDNLAGGAGDQRQRHLRVALVVGGQQPGQAHRGGALYRAEREIAGRIARTRHAQRLVAQRQYTLRVVEKVMAHRRQANALLLTNKQVDANLLFQLAQPRSEVVRLDGTRWSCSAARRASEPVSSTGSMYSLLVNNLVRIIHFS
ncbi:hypothetical protein EIO60_00930|nr:hypothetical protein [Candidatus Pantoea persica]